MKSKISNILLLVIFASFYSSCNSETSDLNQSFREVKNESEKVANASIYNEPHSFGGWFCPDNLKGFPPSNVFNLDKIPVVTGRLPSEVEAKNGTALMFIDQNMHKDAKPLDMELPALARIYSEHTGFKELVIIIQATVIGSDTVVGYRFPSGGNGSGWYGQVELLDNNQAKALGNLPYIYLEQDINASIEEVWTAITKTDYAAELGERFGRKILMSSERSGETVHLDTLVKGAKSVGTITSMWGMKYLQIDTEKEYGAFTEKVIISEGPVEGTSKMQLVFGPYPHDLALHEAKWENWLSELRDVSSAVYKSIQF